MTPEGRVKKKIKAILDKYNGRIYYYMPVPGGFGKQSIDYLGCFCGRFFGIEAKRADKDPTERQEEVLESMNAAGGRTFVIRDDETLEEFAQWLQSVETAAAAH